MRKINKIILHCSATPEGKDFKAKDIKKWHLEKGWNDIGYHYVIDLDGTVEKGRLDEVVGAHCKGHNSDSIGICYVGGCDKNMKAKDTRTQAQKETLIDLVYILMQQYRLQLTDVYCHADFDKSKQCPSFSIDQFRKEYTEGIE